MSSIRVLSKMQNSMDSIHVTGWMEGGGIILQIIYIKQITILPIEKTEKMINHCTNTEWYCVPYKGPPFPTHMSNYIRLLLHLKSGHNHTAVCIVSVLLLEIVHDMPLCFLFAHRAPWPCEIYTYDRNQEMFLRASRRDRSRPVFQTFSTSRVSTVQSIRCWRLWSWRSLPQRVA
jgi:hypothetical protein